MCYLYASTPASLYGKKRRSVRLHGVVTSISLEVQFWDLLEEIAGASHLTLPQFLAQLYDEVMELRGEVSNFASLLRVACTRYLLQRQEPFGAERQRFSVGLPRTWRVQSA